MAMACVCVLVFLINYGFARCNATEQSGRPPPTALSRRTKVDPNSCLEHGERSPWQHA